MPKRLQTGIDLHQEDNHICLMDENGQMVRPLQRFADNWPGPQRFVDVLVDTTNEGPF